jgi:hypothetical protein
VPQEFLRSQCVPVQPREAGRLEIAFNGIACGSLRCYQSCVKTGLLLLGLCFLAITDAIAVSEHVINSFVGGTIDFSDTKCSIFFA